MSKYKINGLPWSCGLGIDVQDCTTAKEVMEKAKLDFVVKKCKLVAKMPYSLGGNNDLNEEKGDFAYQGNIFRDCPSAYATYRTDKNIPLGLVKEKYEVVQNLDAFNFFDDAIGKDKAQWQTAGYLGYGQKIFVVAKLPETIKVGNDVIENYLVFSNSHDGSSAVNILFSPIRVICTNMLNSALNSANSYIRIRHTRSVKERIQTGSEILKIACEHAKSAEDIYNALRTIRMTDDQVMRYIANLNLTEEERTLLNNFDPKNGYSKLFARDYMTIESSGVSTRKLNSIVNMFEYYLDGIGQKNITGTAWGAYNAVTGFYSNVANLEGEKRFDSLLYGSANRVMNKGLNEAAAFAA